MIRFEVRPSVLLFIAALALLSTTFLGWQKAIGSAVLITICVLFHELAHAFFARRFGVRVKTIGISLKGGYTLRSRSDRPLVEALITAAGPAASLFLFTVLIILASGAMTRWIAHCNLVLALANLVPIGPSDGMRLVKLIASAFR